MNDILSNSTYVEDIKRVLKKLDLKRIIYMTINIYITIIHLLTEHHLE